MNVHLTKSEYQDIPFRSEVDRYMKGEYYRDKAYPNTIFKYVGDESNKEPVWWAFGVTYR